MREALRESLAYSEAFITQIAVGCKEEEDDELIAKKNT